MKTPERPNQVQSGSSHDPEALVNDHALFLKLINSDPHISAKVTPPARIKKGLWPDTVAKMAKQAKLSFAKYSALKPDERTKFWETNSPEKTEIEATLNAWQKEWDTNPQVVTAKNEAASKASEPDPEKLIDQELANEGSKEKASLKPPDGTAETLLQNVGLGNVLDQYPEFAEICKSTPSIAQLLNYDLSQLNEQQLAGVKGLIQKRFDGFKVNADVTAEKEGQTDEKLTKAKEFLKNQPDELTLSEIQKLLASDNLNDPALANEPDIANIKNKLLLIQSQLTAIPGVAKTPAEAAVLQNIVANTPTSWKADAPSQRYAKHIVKIEAAYSQGQISQETADAAFSKFGISKNHTKPDLKTGSDVQEAMNKGWGKETYTKTVKVEEPPGSGKYVYKKEKVEGKSIPYSSDRPLKLGKGQEYYEEGNGKRILRIQLPGRILEAEFAKGQAGNSVGEMTYTLQTMHAMARLNLAEAIWQKGNVVNKGGRVALHNTDHIKARRIGSMFMGGYGEGSDGALQNQEEMNQLVKTFKSLNKKDYKAKMGNDQETGQSSLKELGVITANRDIDWDRMEALAHFIKNARAKGGIVKFHDLKAFLDGQFPDDDKPDDPQ